MTEKNKNTNAPQRGPGFFRQLFEQVRLAWVLLKDDRVPLIIKIIPVAAIVYVISPFDLIPDIIPVLGQLDDLGIVMAALTMFNSLAPTQIVEEHLAYFRTGIPVSNMRNEGGTVIDVKPNRPEQPED